jgi:hypothetical protein
MDRHVIRSTSRASAECSDVVLRETETTRLVFRPFIIENPNDPDAGVKGTFIFQKKSPKDEWQDTATIPLSGLKKGEGYRLELRSSELLKLYEEVTGLYRIHAASGVPIGTTEYVRADSLVGQLTQLPASELRGFLSANAAIGSSLLSKLLAWATDAEDPSVIVQRLVALAPGSLRKLNAAIGLESLKRALALWGERKTESDEEFWQSSLGEHSFVLEQVFSWPATIVKGKAYVGGKSVLNTGGSIVDFLVKNQITDNAALVEIKTPVTPLLGNLYRNAVYNVSEDLSGAAQQIANYKHTLQQDHRSVVAALRDRLSAFEPRCVVLIGNATDELADDEDKIKSFELFRRNMTAITIITYDELFQKAQNLVEILECPVSQGK